MGTSIQSQAHPMSAKRPKKPGKAGFNPKKKSSFGVKGSPAHPKASILARKKVKPVEDLDPDYADDQAPDHLEIKKHLSLSEK